MIITVPDRKLIDGRLAKSPGESATLPAVTVPDDIARQIAAYVADHGGYTAIDNADPHQPKEPDPMTIVNHFHRSDDPDEGENGETDLDEITSITVAPGVRIGVIGLEGSWTRTTEVLDDDED